jgi:hypothetical protein
MRSDLTSADGGLSDLKPNPSQWKTRLDLLSKTLIGKRAEVEVAALQIGDQVAAEWLPLLGITYDRKDDLVEVAMDGFDHLIRGPREINLLERDGQWSAIRVVDAEEIQHIIRLKEPLMLPPPTS